MGDAAFRDAAAGLVDLSNEIDDLDAARLALSKRLDRARSFLNTAGDRTALLRGSAGLLRSHLADNAEIAADLNAIREEMRQLGRSITEVTAESLGMLFEAEGFQESLAEAEEEMERLISILVGGKPRDCRGH
jgi:chromosome segregation ATPase